MLQGSVVTRLRTDGIFCDGYSISLEI